MSGPPWALDAPVPSEDLDGPLKADVLVLGAGPASVAAALRLQATGARVVLLPPRPWEQSYVWHGAGVALPAMAEHYSVLVRDLGRETARRWWSLAVEGAGALRTLLTRLECDALRGGVLLLPANEAEEREQVDGLRDLTDDGFSPRMMGAAAATNFLPVDSDAGALYLAGAVVFDPARALAALVRRAAAAGVRVLSPDPAHEGRITAEILVLGEGSPLREGLERRLLPLRGQSLATGRVREGMTEVTVAAAANRGHEVYRAGPDGGLLAAGINPGSGPKESTEDLEVDPAFQEFLERFLHERFPEARRTDVTRRWATLYEFSVDGLPLVGPLPGHTRVHVLRGFGASPWSLAWGAGEALAAALGGGESALPEGASPRRFPS